jgi:RHH-type proline utilization regulon transcriptional repressor/proline dehydrogenase/delta 1-pyrroline-5-carboxylate dehydrogenase
VRRLLENTSNEGFLRAKDVGGATADALLANPVGVLGAGPAANGPAAPAPPAFRNAPNTDFTREDDRARMRAALARVSASLGARHPIVIGGRSISDREMVASVNPARPSQVVGRWARATAADADAAVAAARAAWPAWAARAPEERAAILDRAAAIIEERRFGLGALEVLEAAKPWIEADADISEAVDFCRFYAAEMRALGRPRATQEVPGESNTLGWTPRGVGVAIAPWNFPLAILCGMTVAPLVAGNAVIMKPAEQTTVVAAALMGILVEAGVPAGAVNFVPGLGEDVGARLVAHPGIDFIAFTGSRSVGCRIWEAAGRTLPGQANLKKVVCEMGGKNALIVDNDADLDEAIPAALYSAFGYSGQKCSALSRLVVLDGVHDRFVERFAAACASIPVGDPAEPGTLVGPVIDAQARDKILAAIARGRTEARVAFEAKPYPGADGGFYVPPTVFVDVPRSASIAREEIFGPVVAVLRARDLDEAFAIAMEVDYALTGGLFSRSPSALERARREYRVGNLYLNRGITGAVVERQPFGGFRMSGGGTKAGGKGYLENFLFPCAVAENVMRRGFTPPPGE